MDRSGLLIGGWFAGIRVREVRARDAVVIGLTIGAGLALIVGGVAEALGLVLANSSVNQAAGPLSGFVLVYSALLGTLGAVIGSNVESGRARAQPPRDGSAQPNGAR